MNCDRIARPYRWIEYAAFGRKLEHHRFRFLSAVIHSRRALLLGDGDGRFVAALAGNNPSVHIDSIESSANMIRIAKQRLQTKQIPVPERINFIRADALSAELQPCCYDLVVTNFLLDCFTTAQATHLIESVRTACRPGANWIVSDFQQPLSGWRALHGKIWLRIMYLFFRLATSLEINRLPSYREALRSSGFALQASHTSMAGLICSELWTLIEPPPDRS